MSPSGKSSASLGTDWTWNVRDKSSDLWGGVLSRKSQKMRWEWWPLAHHGVPYITKNELKNWMLEQSIDNKDCSNIRFLLKMLLRSSHQGCSVKKGVFRNFSKFTGKHMCQSLCHTCFLVNFEKFLRTPFLQNTSGRLLLDVLLSFLGLETFKKFY